MQVEVSKRAQRQWLRILIYYNEMGGQRAAANLTSSALQHFGICACTLTN